MVIPAPRPRRDPAVTETESIIRQDEAFCAAMRRAILMQLEHEPVPAPYEGAWKPVRIQVLTQTYSLTSSSAGWLDGGER
jgi:hypothetical protein